MRHAVDFRQVGAFGLQLLLLGQEHACVVLVACRERLAGQPREARYLGGVLVHEALRARLLRHDARSLPLHLYQIVGQLAQVLLDHLGRILAPIQRVIDVRLSDIGKAVKYAHSLSISRLAPPPAPHARALSAEV